MTTSTKENVKQQIAALNRITVGQLQDRYAEVFDEPARSGNRQWLLRRVAWRIQMLAEGNLARWPRPANEPSTLRAADLRVRLPAAPPPVPNDGANVASGPMVAHRDERIPTSGTVLMRRFKEFEYNAAGIEFVRRPARSLRRLQWFKSSPDVCIASKRVVSMNLHGNRWNSSALEYAA